MGASFGFTVFLYGIVLLLSPVGPSWLGVFGILGGVATLVAGIIQAHTGFSDIALSTGMTITLAVLVWTIFIGVSLLRAQSSDEGAA